RRGRAAASAPGAARWAGPHRRAPSRAGQSPESASEGQIAKRFVESPRQPHLLCDPVLLWFIAGITLRGGRRDECHTTTRPGVPTHMNRDSELALIDRLRVGDADAFDAVYEAFNRRLYTFLLRLTRRRDVAEDLLEETWLRVVKHARRLRKDTRLGPWLFTVA